MAHAVRDGWEDSRSSASRLVAGSDSVIVSRRLPLLRARRSSAIPGVLKGLAKEQVLDVPELTNDRSYVSDESEARVPHSSLKYASSVGSVIREHAGDAYNTPLQLANRQSTNYRI